MGTQANELTEKKKCSVCGKSFKNVGAHIKRSHPAAYGAKLKSEGNSSSAPSAAPAQPEVGLQRFVSSRAPYLTVVVEPERQGFINTAAGSMHTTLPGIKIQFTNGIFETDDPKLIDYLENKYKDRRYPVTNVTKLGA